MIYHFHSSFTSQNRHLSFHESGLKEGSNTQKTPEKIELKNRVIELINMTDILFESELIWYLFMSWWDRTCRTGASSWRNMGLDASSWMEAAVRTSKDLKLTWNRSSRLIKNTHKRLQPDGVEDSCKATEKKEHFWFLTREKHAEFSEEEVDVEGIYSLYLQVDFSETHSEQSGKLKSSSERHLQLSGRRQVQSALDRHADAVTAVLHADRRRRTETLTKCDSWMFPRRMSSVLPAVTGETGPQL